MNYTTNTSPQPAAFSRQKSAWLRDERMGRVLAGLAMLAHAGFCEAKLESHLMFARDARIISESEFTALVSQTVEVRKMLYALMKRLAQEEQPKAAG